ncbi:MAG: hypothetical protein L3J06_10135, partial [Cyclobacteriaceae bacterium]|nr:hypothetical protein [Cyclobacteriaceae bacterium]
MKKTVQNHQLVALVVLVSSLFSGYQTYAQRYPAVFDPTTVAFNGTNGFVVPGLDAANQLGDEDVQFIGDINNDGIEDLAMGNSYESVGALSSAGKTYII